MGRIKIDIPCNEIAAFKIKIRISDVNYGNHVGNDSFVSLIHEARLQWLQQGGFTELNIDGAGLIMSDLAFEFKSECFYGEEIQITLMAGEIARVSFELFYSISTIREGQSVLLAKAKTGMVCYEYKEKKIVTVPEVLKQLLTKFK